MVRSNFSNNLKNIDGITFVSKQLDEYTASSNARLTRLESDVKKILDIFIQNNCGEDKFSAG